jgi:hypothetical protein
VPQRERKRVVFQMVTLRSLHDAIAFAAYQWIGGAPDRT